MEEAKSESLRGLNKSSPRRLAPLRLHSISLHPSCPVQKKRFRPSRHIYQIRSKLSYVQLVDIAR